MSVDVREYLNIFMDASIIRPLSEVKPFLGLRPSYHNFTFEKKRFVQISRIYGDSTFQMLPLTCISACNGIQISVSCCPTPGGIGGSPIVLRHIASVSTASKRTRQFSGKGPGNGSLFYLTWRQFHRS